MHSKHDAREITANARAASPASLAYWRRVVDPDEVLTPSERERRAQHAKKAHYARLSMLAAQAKRAKR